MTKLYWWSRSGNFSPGIGALPHMGEVITYYRKMRYDTQHTFSLAANCSLRAVQEWESAIMTRDEDRRIFLAKFLDIPPALLGLDWHRVAYLDGTGNLTGFFPDLIERIEEDAYYQFEDILVMGWECVHNGKSLEITPRIDRRLRKLIEVTKKAPMSQQEAWQYLLCQFYQLHTHIARHYGIDETNKKKVLQEHEEALRIARGIDDARLLAATLFRGSEIHMEQDNYDLAKEDIQGALDHIEQVGTPLKVTIYLFAANAHAVFTGNDTSLEEDINGWLDTSLNIVHKGKMEDDGNFLKPNLAAVHHEKAKTYMKFHELHPKNPQHLKDARRELNLAWKALTPDLAEWRMNFFLTDSKLFLAEHDIEGTSKTAINALKQANFIKSTKGKEQVMFIYSQLKEHGEINPYVDNLGVQLGIFG
jgi:hypothetical protein